MHQINYFRHDMQNYATTNITNVKHAEFYKRKLTKADISFLMNTDFPMTIKILGVDMVKKQKIHNHQRRNIQIKTMQLDVQD